MRPVSITPLDPDRPAILAHARGRMYASECAFWDGVRAGARDHGGDLAGIAHHTPAEACDVPVLCVRNGLDGWPAVDACSGWSAIMPGDQAIDADVADESELLEIARFWQGEEPPPDARHLTRLRALRRFARVYTHALGWLRPSFALIWNGYHPQARVLAGLCERAAIPTHRCERGPIPGTLHTDANGILGASSIARAHINDLRPSRAALCIAQETADRLARGTRTWWTQPEPPPGDVRSRFGVHATDRMLLFAGQVGRDVQARWFGSGHASNADAFRAFLRALPRDRADLFVLGKHHPQSDTPPAVYRRVLEDEATNAAWRGAWVDDVPLHDALRRCDGAAAVNSTVLAEACARGLPVLQMGESILSNKQIAFGLHEAEAWIDCACTRERRANLQTTLAALVDDDKAARPLGGLWSMTPASGRAGPRELGAHLASIARDARAPEFGALPAAPPLLDEASLWDRARRGGSRPDQAAA